MKKPFDYRYAELRLKELWTFAFFLGVALVAIVTDALLNSP